MDDLKIAGEPHVVRQVLATLHQHFGELKISWNTFINCGAQHTQCPKTKEITSTISHPQMSTGKLEDKAAPGLHQLFMSLLGAVADLSHTRVDILVFVSAPCSATMRGNGDTCTQA